MIATHKFPMPTVSLDLTTTVEAVAPDVASAIRRCTEWHLDLKSIRDPVAHRIPIYAVPSVLTQEQADRYRSVYERGERARTAGELDLAAKLLKELNLIGDYVPYFAHSPSDSEKMRKVYPQVADDLAIILDLADSIIAHLEHGRL